MISGFFDQQGGENLTLTIFKYGQRQSVGKIVNVCMATFLGALSSK